MFVVTLMINLITLNVKAVNKATIDTCKMIDKVFIVLKFNLLFDKVKIRSKLIQSTKKYKYF